MISFFRNQTLELHYQDDVYHQLQTRKTTVYNVADNVLEVRALDVSGSPIDPAIGADLEVYIIRPDAIYSFETALQDKRLSPVPLLVVPTPDEGMARLQRRQFFRLDVHMRVRFRMLEQDERGVPAEEMTHTQNLSAGGCSCLLHESCRVGDMVSVLLFLPESDEKVQMNGRIVRRTELKKASSEKASYGIKFIDISDQVQARISRFLIRRQAQLAKSE